MSIETGQGINSSKCVNGSAPTHLFLLLEKLYRIKRIVKDINLHMSFTYVKPKHKVCTDRQSSKTLTTRVQKCMYS